MIRILIKCLNFCKRLTQGYFTCQGRLPCPWWRTNDVDSFRFSRHIPVDLVSRERGFFDDFKMLFNGDKKRNEVINCFA